MSARLRSATSFDFNTREEDLTKDLVYFDSETDPPIGSDPINFDEFVLAPTVMNCVFDSAESLIIKAELCSRVLSKTSRKCGEVIHNQACNMASILTDDFMTFDRTTKVLMIFRKCTSMAITFDSNDFISRIIPTTRPLKLGEMAHSMKIEGVYTVSWTFQDKDRSKISIEAQAYYVPKSKVRLCSLQRLFNQSKGVTGRYKGDKHSLRLLNRQRCQT